MAKCCCHCNLGTLRFFNVCSFFLWGLTINPTRSNFGCCCKGQGTSMNLSGFWRKIHILRFLAYYFYLIGLIIGPLKLPNFGSPWLNATNNFFHRLILKSHAWICAILLNPFLSYGTPSKVHFYDWTTAQLIRNYWWK